MRLGIKLDIDFSESQLCRQLYADRQILGYLRELGFEAVEAPIGAESDHHALLEYVRQCHQAGLLVSLHPYTEGTSNNPTFFSPSEDNPCRQLHQRFLVAAAEVARLQQAQTVVNIHPAAARENRRSKLVDQSVRFFGWAGHWCRANAPGVRVVAELQIRPNPGESLQRVGDNYAELLEITQRSGVEGCWDFGHAFMNTRRFGLPLEPPAELRPRIAHVHCHDVDLDDHQPLVFGNVPWERFVESLVGDGFDGSLILEVPTQNFLAAGGLDALSRSAHALANQLNRPRNKAQQR